MCCCVATGHQKRRLDVSTNAVPTTGIDKFEHHACVDYCYYYYRQHWKISSFTSEFIVPISDILYETRYWRTVDSADRARQRRVRKEHDNHRDKHTSILLPNVVINNDWEWGSTCDHYNSTYSLGQTWINQSKRITIELLDTTSRTMDTEVDSIMN